MGLFAFFTTARLVTLLLFASHSTEVDAKGKETVTSSRLVQQPGQSVSTVDIGEATFFQGTIEAQTGNKWHETSTVNKKNIKPDLNSTFASIMESALTDFFMTKTCKKNTPVLLHPTSTPYPVIHSSEFPGVDTPLLCDTVTDGGGWIVIQRRSTGDVDFNRNWASYKEGFGTLNTDFWLGNEKIHAITSTGKFELRVEIKYKGQSKYALYGSFCLAGEDDKYSIHFGSYSGTAGDSLRRHNDRPFTTYDRDNDAAPHNCAELYKGGWWFDDCFDSSLHGKWGVSGSWQGVIWKGVVHLKSVAFTEMKIRRVDD